MELDEVVACENWAMLKLGEIAALDAGKQRCKRDGNLDIMQLVHLATPIKAALETGLMQVAAYAEIPAQESGNVLEVLKSGGCHKSRLSSANQITLITRIWAHAALLYLSIVVSGWQPASSEVRDHVRQVLSLLSQQNTVHALIRTLVWPCCVAGCLAGPAGEPHFRALLGTLQPISAFGTASKAFDIMESVWRSRGAEGSADRDLASYFRLQGELVLLV
jgi:C6 transcription factor Pro1